MLTTTDIDNIKTSLLSVVGYKVTYLELFKENLSVKSLDELDQSIIDKLENDIEAFYKTIFKMEKLRKIVESGKFYSLGDL